MPTSIGSIRVKIHALDDTEVARELTAEIKHSKDNFKDPLDPTKLPGKIWQLFGKLDSLSGIISKIDDLAKVCFFRS